MYEGDRHHLDQVPRSVLVPRAPVLLAGFREVLWLGPDGEIEALSAAEARARVGSIQVTPEVLNNPELFKKFQDAQNQLTGALKSLFAVTENYPQLKSDQNFRDLQSQLEGTENRITVARNRYIQAVQDYNVTVRTFPTLITAKVFGFQVKPNFSVANEQQISTAPAVSFDTSTPGSPATPPPQPAGSSPTR